MKRKKLAKQLKDDNFQAMRPKILEVLESHAMSQDNSVDISKLIA